jgi:hypothetical protein
LWKSESERIGARVLICGCQAEIKRTATKKAQALFPERMERQGRALELISFLVLANIGGTGSQIPGRRGFVGLQELQEFGGNLQLSEG